jgi:hypothetical protein
MLYVEGNPEGTVAKDEGDNPTLANMLSRMKTELIFGTFVIRNMFFAILFHFSTCAGCIADHLNNNINRANVL